jgi:hypothetical protein
MRLPLVNRKDVWKAVQYTREREGQNIPTLDQLRNTVVIIEENEELLRLTRSPILL